LGWDCRHESTAEIEREVFEAVMKMKVDEVIVGIIVIGCLEALAIAKGIDGSYLGLVIATITGLLGYKAGRSKR